MAPETQTEHVYSGRESVGMVILVACCTLSLISISTIFVILGVSAVRSRRSSDKTLFVRTHVSKYFVSILICNLLQSIGGLLNIPYIIESRVYTGVSCTVQGFLKQLGNSGTGIFCFVIAVHTFSVLFLRRQWSARACYIVLILSWGLDFLELFNEYFILAKPEEKGPYFGIAGQWCWITPAYPLERYFTSYLIMCTSAALSSILYVLIFFRLRGNITLSAGYKIRFQRRPKVRVGRTSDGAYVVTDDRRVESHLTRVAQHMLWYPLVYTGLVLPQAASRFSEFSGASVPFPVTIFTSALFLLHGFFNTVLFCTTRNILPGNWRQRLGISSLEDCRRSDVHLSSRTNPMWRVAVLSTRIGEVSTGTAPVILSVGVEKDVEIKYDDTQPIPSYLKVRSPSSSNSPTQLFRTHGGERAGIHKHPVRPLSFPAPRDARTSDRTEIDGVDDDDDDSYLDAGAVPAAKPIELEGQLQPHESSIYALSPGLEPPESAHLFTTTRLADNTDK